MKLTKARFAAASTMGVGLLLASSIYSSTVPLDPNTFLTMLERYVTEDAATEDAYYAAVDPDNKKTTYADWLFETGFIDDPLDYRTTGAFADHADVAVTHQNVADLGFIRRMRIRCEPSCEAPNPDIYSVIENYRTFDDAASRTNRLASVTMEWTSAADGSRPSNKFVVFYAYTGTDERDESPGVSFQPDLDGRGQKAIPGLCNTCHGGAPRSLVSDGTYRANGNTGGQIAAPIWHDFMAVAHKDMNIPTIPGLQPHPAQLAEQERIAALRITDPALAAQITGEAEAAAKASRKLPDAARDALRRMSSDLRKAAGLAEKPSGGGASPPSPGTLPPGTPAPGTPAPAKKPADRAALPPAPGRTAGVGVGPDGGVP